MPASSSAIGRPFSSSHCRVNNPMGRSEVPYISPCCFSNSRNFHCMEEAVAARDEFVRKVVGSFTKSKDSSIPRKYKNWVDNSKADIVLPVMSNGRMQPSFVIARLSFCCGDRVCGCGINGCYHALLSMSIQG